MANDAESKPGMPEWSGQAGADGNFAEIMQSNVGWVHAAASRQLRDAALADDVVQAVFLALWNKYWEPPDGGQRLRGWLANTTRYICNNLRRTGLRQSACERKAAGIHAEERELAADHADSEQLAALDAAMRRLPSDDRNLLVARFYQGHGFSEVARKLGITEAAARKRVSRTLERLRAEVCCGQSQEDRGHSGLPLIAGWATAPARKLQRIPQTTGGQEMTPPANPVHAGQPLKWRLSSVAARSGIIAVPAAAMLAVAVVCVGPGGPTHREAKWPLRERGELVGAQIAMRLSPKRWPEINGSARKATGWLPWRKASLAVRGGGVDFASGTFRRFPGRPGSEVLDGPNPIPGRENAEIGTTSQ